VTRRVLVPQLSDWRKPFKPRIKPVRPDHKRFPADEPMKSRPQFAKFALMAKELCWVTSKQLEDARREIVKATGRTAKVYLRVYPHNAITQRIADSRTGASKGRFEYWVAALTPGRHP
ncbi:rplP, partial [Symbiodinium natans]